MAATLNNQAELYVKLGQADNAVALFEEAIAIAQDGDMHLATATLTESYGSSLIELRRYESAIETLRDAAGRYATLGDSSSEARTTSMLAQAYEATGETVQASICRERAARLLVGN